MRPWSWKSELRTQAILVAATLGVLFSARAWPQYAWPLWGLFLFCVACYLFRDLADPVNYDSMSVTDEAIDYVERGRHVEVRLDDIGKLEYIRSPGWDYIESSWQITTLGGEVVEILDEWPHRRQLFNAFQRRLPDFDAAAAKKGFRASREGRWLCFQR